MTRRFLVPEVIQTSGMDCGPACLTSLLRGFGITASYGRLREACHTDVDGTSIDTIEEIAKELGLDAEQHLVPVDHVVLAGHVAAPGIAIVRQPTGAPHFVVLWGRTFGRVQIMDPARGRLWFDARAFERDLYVHEMELPATDWRAWAGEPEFTAPLATRLGRIGLADADARIARVLSDPSWRAIATLDAATRMTRELVDAGGLATGADAARVLDTLAPEQIPAAYWSAREAEPDTLRVRGAVIVQIGGQHAAEPKSRELAAALHEPPPRPWRAVAGALAADGVLAPSVLAIGLVAAVIGTVVEVAMFRAAFELTRDLVTAPQLVIASCALVGFLVAMLLVEVPTRAAALRLGRRAELRLRVRLYEKVARLGLHYLRSRPVSDMAERGHSLHRLRDLPPIAVRAARSAGEIVVTAVALIWLVPDAAPLVVLLALACLLPPLVAQRALSERELRMRTHAGALARFYFDALVGTDAARAGGAEAALRREQEGLLVEAARAAHAENRLAVAVTAVLAILGFGLAIVLVLVHAHAVARPASMLLLAYWALAIPNAGQMLADTLRELPTVRNLTLRLLEPLGAIDEEPSSAAPPSGDAGVRLSLEGVSVVAGGHTILSDLQLSIAPGEHVAIVGLSGGGKSTLLGLFLGWVRPATGRALVDGAPLDAPGLRRDTVWIDPAVALWNDSLAQNLAYGAPGADVARVIPDAELEDMIARLPEGLATRLGEGGGLVSGGEGQRVRLGRGIARGRPRLVLLDEPFRGLDRETRARQLAAARRRWAGATMLCVTHDLAETRDFSRVLVIEHGRIAEDGAPAELAARERSRYAALIAGEQHARAAWSRWTRRVLVGGRIEEAR